jgi:hypothetical protein
MGEWNDTANSSKRYDSTTWALPCVLAIPCVIHSPWAFGAYHDAERVVVVPAPGADDAIVKAYRPVTPVHLGKEDVEFLLKHPDVIPFKVEVLSHFVTLSFWLKAVRLTPPTT